MQGFTVDQVNDNYSKQTNNMQVALMPSKDVALPAFNRKPRFLDDLENFLIRELQSLGVEEVEANETRLQVF